MKLYVIFAQRKERYEGEYAPEALELMDEYGVEENGAWLATKLEEHRKNSDLAAVEIVAIDLGSTAQAKIKEKLIGTLELKGTVEE